MTVTMQPPTPRGWRHPNTPRGHAAGWRPITTGPVWVPCWACSGQGRVYRTPGAGVITYQTCGRCLGIGSTPETT